MDYKEYAGLYPALNIDEFINVLHPNSGNPFVNLIQANIRIREMWSMIYAQADGDFPHPIFPAAGGLFPWAYNDDNGYYFWKTGGDPSSWTVVVVESLQWWEHPGGFGDFLSGWTAGTVVSPVLEEGVSGPDYSVRRISE
ncbi:hypothetical protein AB0F91_15980 [Amycolatopsis sp. NPDC023774]|uniref:hypothetical protein n=1 Tax=Amycolatopsis sp. NPDC023774 TaxID=3155015 RepID=UPI0033D1DDE5